MVTEEVEDEVRAHQLVMCELTMIATAKDKAGM